MPPAELAAIENRLVTAQELFEHPEWGTCELIRGKVVFMSPAGARHGAIAFKISLALGTFVELKKCGVVFGTDTGFVLDRKPDTVRGPDVMYLVNERIPVGGIPAEYLPIAPDLAVEVISPTDRLTDVAEKAVSYLNSGVKVVWVVDPQRRRAQVYRQGEPVESIAESGALTAEKLLPGLSIPLLNVFVE